MAFDDLDELPIGSSKPEVAAAQVDNSASDVDFGDADNFHVGDGLDKIIVPEKGAARIALLADIVKPKMGYTHFASINGKINAVRCISKRVPSNEKNGGSIVTKGLCCSAWSSDKEKAQLGFACLAVKYTNVDPKTGKFPTGATSISWELGWLKLSVAGFKAISKKRFEDEQGVTFDIIITHKSNGIGYEYDRATKGNSPIRNNAEMWAAVQEEASAFVDGKILNNRLGRLYTELELKALIAGGRANTSSASSLSVDDI